MKYYIATGLHNVNPHNTLRDLLSAGGHQITYDWTIHGPVWMKGIEVIQQTSVNEIQGVIDADVVIILFPGGRGTHIELGAALGLKKKILMLATHAIVIDSQTCVFYHHPNVEHVQSFVQIREILDEQSHLCIGSNQCRQVNTVENSEGIISSTCGSGGSGKGDAKETSS